MVKSLLPKNAQIDHTAPDSYYGGTDENIGLVAGNVILTASATIIDGDGDVATSSQPLDISGKISFDDDVPTAGTENAAVYLDDDTLTTDSDNMFSCNFGADGAGMLH